MEMWKTVKNYPNYEVSDMGRIRRSCDHRVLKPWRTKNGYIHVMLINENGKKQMLVHRLVAFAFLPIVEGKPFVNHKNCEPSDNRASNLEWCTQSYNVKYAYDNDRAENAARKRLACVETSTEFYSSAAAAAWVNSTKFHNSHNLNTISRTIRQACVGGYGRKTAYGLHWKFV